MKTFDEYFAEKMFELQECKKLLMNANELLRSAYAIAQRNGEQTNWEAFRGQLKKALDAQHESGLTKRAADGAESSAKDELTEEEFQALAR